MFTSAKFNRRNARPIAYAPVAARAHRGAPSIRSHLIFAAPVVALSLALVPGRAPGQTSPTFKAAPPPTVTTIAPPVSTAQLAGDFYDCVFNFDFLNQACMPVITIGCLTTDDDCPVPPPVESSERFALDLELTAARRNVAVVRTGRAPGASTSLRVAPGPVSCGARPATIVGTPGDDVIIGTNGSDVIAGLGGDDRIFGLDGADVICGGADNDYLDAGSGNDIVLGGSGRDRMRGRMGRDWLSGETGDDTISGGPGSDTHQGDDGNDTLRAVLGDDGSPDSVVGGNGIDQMFTNDGVGNDSGDGGLGVDACSVDPGDVVGNC